MDKEDLKIIRFGIIIIGICILLFALIIKNTIDDNKSQCPADFELVRYCIENLIKDCTFYCRPK